MNPLLTARCILSAQFYDIDPMNVVWHGHYTRFFEEARNALLDLLDYNYLRMQESGYFWPVVELQVKYIRPLTLHRKFIVEAELLEYENRLKIRYRILDFLTSEIMTKAHSVQVAVSATDQELQFECPEVFLNKVRKVLK